MNKILIAINIQKDFINCNSDSPDKHKYQEQVGGNLDKRKVGKKQRDKIAKSE